MAGRTACSPHQARPGERGALTLRTATPDPCAGLLSPARARAVVDLYAEIKRAGDSFLGVPTQCFVASKAGIGTGQAPRGRPQYCANVALKVPSGPPRRLLRQRPWLRALLPAPCGRMRGGGCGGESGSAACCDAGLSCLRWGAPGERQAGRQGLRDRRHAAVAALHEEALHGFRCGRPRRGSGAAPGCTRLLVPHIKTGGSVCART